MSDHRRAATSVAVVWTYAERFKRKTDAGTQKPRQGRVPAILALQRTVGNAKVVRVTARASLSNVVGQRTPEDVYTLIHSFQGRLKAKGSNAQAVLHILA
jgi:hypothetical protein